MYTTTPRHRRRQSIKILLFKWFDSSRIGMPNNLWLTRVAGCWLRDFSQPREKVFYIYFFGGDVINHEAKKKFLNLLDIFFCVWSTQKTGQPKTTTRFSYCISASQVPVETLKSDPSIILVLCWTFLPFTDLTLHQKMMNSFGYYKKNLFKFFVFTLELNQYLRNHRKNRNFGEKIPTRSLIDLSWYSKASRRF